MEAMKKTITELSSCTVLFILTIAFICCTKRKADSEYNRFENSVITLEKEPCYGTCPVYTITIKGTGEAVYEGKDHVSKKGKYQKQLGDKETNKLFNAFECSNFSDFRSEYTDNVSDMPTNYLTFEHRGYKKRIRDYYGAPEELKKLEKMVEEIAESEEGWTKINDE